MEFLEFPKIARLSREIIVTEKIDGTNAQIAIGETGEMFVGSRTRWLTAEADNFGFYVWAAANRAELLSLGPGRHFGEWWGSGVQRGYGLPKGEKRFSLFNVTRWALHGTEPQLIPSGDPRAELKRQDVLPPCVGLVPVLYRGPFSQPDIEACVEMLRHEGSVAAPGFASPEGIVVFHTASQSMLKKTLEKDEIPKALAAR